MLSFEDYATELANDDRWLKEFKNKEVQKLSLDTIHFVTSGGISRALSLIVPEELGFFAQFALRKYLEQRFPDVSVINIYTPETLTEQIQMLDGDGYESKPLSDYASEMPEAVPPRAVKRGLR